VEGVNVFTAKTIVGRIFTIFHWRLNFRVF